MPRTYYLYGYLFLLCASGFGCTKKYYQQAILDAMRPTSEKVYDQLTEINQGNSNLYWAHLEDKQGAMNDFVLVASWKKASETHYYQNNIPGVHDQHLFYDTKSYRLFVTAVPDLQDWYQKETKKGNVSRRLAQLLGLPPDTSHRVFIAFWVKPEDLFRPCIDPEITDSSCDFLFNENASSSASPEHLVWLINYTRGSFVKPLLYKEYPFTQLGYTYDWNRKNKSHIGLSEFVVDTNAYVRVAGIFENDEFLNMTGQDLKHMNTDSQLPDK